MKSLVKFLFENTNQKDKSNIKVVHNIVDSFERETHYNDGDYSELLCIVGGEWQGHEQTLLYNFLDIARENRMKICTFSTDKPELIEVKYNHYTGVKGQVVTDGKNPSMNDVLDCIKKDVGRNEDVIVYLLCSSDLQTTHETITKLEDLKFNTINVQVYSLLNTRNTNNEHKEAFSKYYIQW